MLSGQEFIRYSRQLMLEEIGEAGQERLRAATVLIVGLGGLGGSALTDPFTTTKEPGKGLGLGLSIAFNVMQDMGGHLAIEQHPQGGAEVRLRLNRWQEGK